MTRHWISAILALMLASVTWSQDDEQSGEAGASEAAADTVEPSAVDELDDAELDEPGYGEEDEDDFVPTEEVSADQSLPFPVDI